MKYLQQTFVTGMLLENNKYIYLLYLKNLGNDTYFFNQNQWIVFKVFHKNVSNLAKNHI